jgi:hypothetical protein
VLALFTGKMPRDSRCEEALATATNEATRAGRTRSDIVGAQSVMFYADGGNEGSWHGGSCVEGAESVLKHREILMEAITAIVDSVHGRIGLSVGLYWSHL